MVGGVELAERLGSNIILLYNFVTSPMCSCTRVLTYRCDFPMQKQLQSLILHEILYTLPAVLQVNLVPLLYAHCPSTLNLFGQLHGHGPKSASTTPKRSFRRRSPNNVSCRFICRLKMTRGRSHLSLYRFRRCLNANIQIAVRRFFCSPLFFCVSVLSGEAEKAFFFNRCAHKRYKMTRSICVLICFVRLFRTNNPSTWNSHL